MITRVMDLVEYLTLLAVVSLDDVARRKIARHALDAGRWTRCCPDKCAVYKRLPVPVHSVPLPVCLVSRHDLNLPNLPSTQSPSPGARVSRYLLVVSFIPPFFQLGRLPYRIGTALLSKPVISPSFRSWLCRPSSVALELIASLRHDNYRLPSLLSLRCSRHPLQI